MQLLMKNDPMKQINAQSEPSNDQIQDNEQVVTPDPEKIITENNVTVEKSPVLKKNKGKTKVFVSVPQNELYKNVKVKIDQLHEIKKALALNDFLRGVNIQDFVSEAINDKLNKIKKRGN